MSSRGTDGSLRPWRTLLGALVLVAAGVTAPAAEAADSRGELHSIDPDAAGECLGAKSISGVLKIQMVVCDGGRAQHWFLWEVSPPLAGGRRYHLRTLAQPDRCIDAAQGHGKQLLFLRCDNTGTQDFFVRRVHGRLVFESAYYPGQCMDVRDWGRSNVVQLWDCHLGTNQQWYVVGQI
jgi:hypothetical protein